MDKILGRNLRLAIVDDDLKKSLADAWDLVDLVVFEPSRGPSLSHWDAHCRNAAIRKEICFDLCSIDMNFQEDWTDPVRPKGTVAPRDATGGATVAVPERMTASGFYHGMALLARRKSTDDAGNTLPLAWEVRSATPSEFGKRADLQADAVRGYGLLRALLANPEDEQETLEDCVRREFREAWPDRGELLGENLREVLEDDLDRQEPSAGLVDGILHNLLPKWRRRFLESVRRRDVRLNIKEMERQMHALKALSAEHPGWVSVYECADVCIPLQGLRKIETSDAIRLTSVMADLAASGEIELRTANEHLTDGTAVLSVLEWFGKLIEIENSGFRAFADLFRKTSEKFERTIRESNEAAVSDLWEACQGVQANNKRVFLYILMRVRLWMLSNGSERQDPADKSESGVERVRASGRSIVTLSSIYGFLGAHEQTYRRALKESLLASAIGTPQKLRHAVVGALADRQGALIESEIWDKWLAQELYRYCTTASPTGLGLRVERIAKLAPGLVPVSSPPQSR